MSELSNGLTMTPAILALKPAIWVAVFIPILAVVLVTIIFPAMRKRWAEAKGHPDD